MVVESAVATADTSLYIQSVDGAGDENSYRWNVGGATAGGVQEASLQLFAYENGGFEAEYLRCGPINGPTEGVVFGRWGNLDATRAGTAPALVLGANAVACPSIKASSQVLLTGIVGTADAGGLAAYAAAIPVPAVVVAAGVGFTVTALAAHVGLIYSYQVIG